MRLLLWRKSKKKVNDFDGMCLGNFFISLPDFVFLTKF